MKEKVCENCLNEFPLNEGSQRKTCSTECSRELASKTMLKKYGVENIMQLEEFKKKFKSKKSKEFSDNLVKMWKNKSKEEKKEIQRKKRETCLQKYGEDNPFKSEKIKEKIKQKHIENLGVEYPSQSQKVINKRRENNLKKYGVINPTQLWSIKEKTKENCLQKYGVYNGAQINISKEVIDLFNSKEKVELLYKEENFSCISLARKYNVSPSFILLKLHAHEIHIKNPTTSSSEDEIAEFVKFLGFEVIRNSRSILSKGKEIDIFIPDKNIGIEFNGLFWHKEQQLLKFGKNKFYHFEKTNLAEKEGIHMIHIYEDSWLLKKDIVKDRLKNILGKQESTLFARKCCIKELSYNETSDFLEKNHLQGSCFSLINLGLIFNEKIVAVMTFGKLRKALGQKSKENEYELLRFCSKGRVVGGSSKLFKYFLKKYYPNKIISYADKDWVNKDKNLYISLGFQKISDGKPSYWYIINNVRQHRFNYRKSILSKKLLFFDSSTTEYKNMLKNGYDRIWGCGSYKYEFLPS